MLGCRQITSWSRLLQYCSQQIAMKPGRYGRLPHLPVSAELSIPAFRCCRVYHLRMSDQGKCNSHHYPTNHSVACLAVPSLRGAKLTRTPPISTSNDAYANCSRNSSTLLAITKVAIAVPVYVSFTPYARLPTGPACKQPVCAGQLGCWYPQGTDRKSHKCYNTARQWCRYLYWVFLFQAPITTGQVFRHGQTAVFTVDCV